MQHSIPVHPVLKRYYAQLRRWILALYREYRDDNLEERAKSLVYTTLLSLAPLLAVSFSLLKAFGVHNQLQPVLLQALAPLGGKASEISNQIMQFVDGISAGILGMAGFVMLFYTVIGLIAKIEDALNRIWRINRPRSFIRRCSDYLSMVMLGPVLAFAAAGIVGSAAGNLSALPWLSGWGGLALQQLTPLLLVVCAFSFVYLLIPNTRVNWSAALGGGLAAGLSWKLTGSLFTAFVVSSASYNAIYSGFASIILFIIWLNFSWLILLLGGVIAFHLQYPLYLNYADRQQRLSPAGMEQTALALMFLMGKQHYLGENPLSLHELADRLKLPWEALTEIMARLRQRHLLIAADETGGRYEPARDTDGILLKDILLAVRDCGDLTRLPGDFSPVMENLCNGLTKAYLDTAKQTTLRELILEQMRESDREA